MDMTLFTGAAGAIKASIDIAQAALAARDATQVRDALTQINNNLVQLQSNLLDTIIKAGSLADELHMAKEENRKLKAAIEQRGDYTLFPIRPGGFVMRSKVDERGLPPVGGEPLHYLCQRCFDSGHKVVLQRIQTQLGVRWDCTACKTHVYE